MEKKQIEVINNFIDFSKSNEFISKIQKDFNNLKEVTNEIRSLNLKTNCEGEKEVNRKKNRYRDILPYDESRVKLDLVKLDESNYEAGSDYINASFITNVLDGYYKYIAAQGPNKDTIVDFIRMLVQFNVKIVLCACNEYEGQKLKCHRYWTDDQNEAFCIYKNYYVTLKSKPIVLDDCIIRQIKVIYNPNFLTQDSNSASNLENSNRSILEYEFTQFHLINWPDHGVPNNIESIINILGIVRKKMIENNKLLNENFNKINGSQNGKNLKKIHFPLSNDFLVVHCSAGCGRTGTIIAIDQLWAMINETKLDESFSLYEIAKALREQRIAMIQTQSQYLFFARATALLFEKYLKSLSNRVEKYPKNPVKSQNTNSKISASQMENKPTMDISPPDSNSQINRKNYLDSNNNDYSSQNFNKSVLKKNEFIESSNLTPPKSPNNRLKSANITKSPLTSVKQKINRLVPNMFQIFSPNSTPTITNYTQNYGSNVQTPISLSSVSSSPSPLSVSSSSSASSASNAKNSATKVIPRSNLAESYDESPSLYIKHKTQSKISTPTSTISYNNKNNESTSFSSKSLFMSSDANQQQLVGNRARSTSRLTNNGTPILISNITRKLSNTSEKSSEYDLSQPNSDNTELYLNDKSMSKKEPGSGCEFLTHKLNSNRQLHIDLHSNNNIPKSAIQYHTEDTGPFVDGSTSVLNFKHIVNSAKFSSSKEIDLRQLNQPMKAELYDSLSLKPSDNQENKLSEQSSETPKPPVRTKIHQKRFNMNENTRNAIYNMIDRDFSNESCQNSVNEPATNQGANKYVEIRVNKSSKSGANLDSYSDNFATRNYRNGILLDINSNSHKDFELKENLQEQTKPAQSFYRFKSSKYDILTLPNKKYNHYDKNESKKSEDQELGSFPFNSNSMAQSAKTKLRQNSNYTFNKDLSINVQYVPNKNHYYYLINNLKNPLSSKFNNRKSLKLDQITNDYYDNNFGSSNENYNDNRNSQSKRRSTQVFDL